MDYSKILITGGTGFLGRNLAKKLKNKDIIIYSREESKQAEMREEFPNFKYVLGDVCDYQRLREAMRGAELVIHTAAAKFVDWGEEQPTNCVNTNLIGSINVIRACKEEKAVCVATSTDKVPYTRNVYGASKLIMEALLREAGDGFYFVRYGNVIGSTGSVIPKWIKSAKERKPIYVTGPDMRRFFMTVDEATDLVLRAVEEKRNIICDTMKAIDMRDLAEVIADGKVEIKYMPPRPGERPYEILRADYEGGEYSTKNATLFSKEEIKRVINNEIRRNNIKTV